LDHLDNNLGKEYLEDVEESGGRMKRNQKI
jgi:hypothetical protein